MSNEIKKLDKKYTDAKRKKLFVYKIVAVALAAIVAFGLANFTNMPQANERSIVTMMAIDKHEDGVLISAHMLVATPGIMENEFRQDLSYATGRNIFEAMSKLCIAKGRKAEFSQCGLIVFGNGLAQEGILEHTKALLASNTVSGGTLLLTTNGKGSDFLDNAGLLGEQTSENIAKFITKFQNTLKMPMLVLVTYLNGEMGESGASFMPILEFSLGGDIEEEDNEEAEAENEEAAEEACCRGEYYESDKEEKAEEKKSRGEHCNPEDTEIEDKEELEEENRRGDRMSHESAEEETEDKEEEVLDENPQENDKTNNQETQEEDDTQEHEPPPEQADIASVSTAAIFKHGKKVGLLKVQETRGLNLVMAESRRGRYIIDGFTHSGEEYGSIVGEVRSKRVRIKTTFQNGKPVIEYSIKAKVDITSNHELAYLLSTGNTNKVELYRSVEAAFQEAIIADIEASIFASKELDADFMQIQYRFWRRNRREMVRYKENNNNEESSFLQDLTAQVSARVKAR